MRVQNRAARKSNGVALGHESWTLERHSLMVELENLKVAVAKFFGEAAFVDDDDDDDDAWP